MRSGRLTVPPAVIEFIESDELRRAIAEAERLTAATQAAVMNQPTEPLDRSKVPPGRIAEAVRTLDGRGWIASDAQGRPVRLGEADADDVAIIDLAMSWREEPDR